MPPDAHTPDLRASDADREAAGERLRVAAMEGRLEPSELDERMSAAYAARWCSELAALTADVTPAPPPNQELARPTFARPAGATNGLAIVSLIAGLLWMWWIGSILAVVFGHAALNQIARTGQPGRGIAIAGLALGYIGLATMLFTIFAVALA
ncbi:MAG TPA: DUF1707 and DUF4190 domain-containing protein [Solirubrobacteraceae bacterium]|nr:DUF1707 and DUF4190 domain-containing protein [Solirubrobacteraceae bacterium]